MAGSPSSLTSKARRFFFLPLSAAPGHEMQLLQALPKGHVISRAMPANQTDHQVHVIGVGPDNLLYFNQGAET